MLYTYQYVPHSMEKMQEYIDFIFFEVWCKAPRNGDFRLELFDANLELKELMETFYYGDTQGGDFFYGHVESIYNHFVGLTHPEVEQFKQWYLANNDIEKVCANDPAVQIARYEDIKAPHPDLCEQLARFCKGLYSQQLLNLKAVRDNIGQIEDHYKELRRANPNGKCPFCGIIDIMGEHHTKREAYDHYLPKSLYPFNSINFHNLAPACHTCNSSYKQGKDPVTNASGRRKAFYPYADLRYDIEVKIGLNKADIDQLKPEDIQLKFGPPHLSEEIESWKEVYGIEDRYKAKCCGDNDGKYWFAQVADEWKEGGRVSKDFLNMLDRQATKYPLAESNFLKSAFLQACHQVGLFDADE